MPARSRVLIRSCSTWGIVPRLGIKVEGILCGRKTNVEFNLEQAEHQISERRSQQRAVDYVQDPAEARHQTAAVFNLGVALHEGFEQVAQLPDAADDYAEDEAFAPRQRIDRRVDPAG